MEKFDELREALKGNEEAYQFVELITEVLHFWDDLIDQDKKLLPEEINSAMTKALVSLPRNNFYRQNFSELNPILVNAIINWHTANEFENSDGNYELSEYELSIAFIIRSCYIDLVLHSITICGGIDWCRKWAPKARLHWHAEKFDGYKLALAKEKEAKNGIM